MRFDARGQAAHQRQVLEVDGVGAADGERNAVHHQRKSFSNTLEKRQRLAAGYQIVFGDDFEPIDRVRLVEDGLIVGSSQAKAEAEECHQDGAGLSPGPPSQCFSAYFAGAALAFAAAQASLVMDT